MHSTNNHQALYMQAMQAYQAGNLSMAEKLLRELSSALPQLSPIQVVLGGVLVANGKAKEAVRLLSKIVQKEPNNLDALINLSSAQKARGKHQEALTTIEKATQLDPKRADIHYNMGNILVELNLNERAEEAFEMAVQLDTQLVPAYMSLGNLKLASQEMNHAAKYFRKVLELQADYPSALMNLGNVLADLGKMKEAELLYQKLITSQPKSADGYQLLGKLYLDQGKTTEALDVLEKAIELNPEDVNGLVLLGNLAKELGKKEEAEAYYSKALQYDPANQGAKQNLSRLLQAQIPGWHFTMLADSLRNDAYQQAIEKIITPESRVLDIGTGTGLLAMMAARAGAKSVTACEMHTKLAQVAEEIVAMNGYANQIQILNKKSTDLQVGQGLDEKCDVLIAEILDVGVVGEGVLPTYRHARQALLTENVKIIPAQAHIYGQLLEIPSRSIVSPVQTISGFDLSAFNRFQIENEYKTVHLSNESHTKLSAIFPIKQYDFYHIPPAIQDNFPQKELLTISIEQDGEVQAIAFWFDLFLDEEIMVSSKPDGDLKHWGQALFCLPTPKKVKAGEELKLHFVHSDQLISFELL